VTARINATVYNVAIGFDGKEGTVGRAEIVETSRPGASERTCELVVSGLPEGISRAALAALGTNRTVDVRVLGFYGLWTVTETAMESESGAFRLKSAGYIMATHASTHTVEG
jgi:hypothetical protein